MKEELFERRFRVDPVDRHLPLRQAFLMRSGNSLMMVNRWTGVALWGLMLSVAAGAPEAFQAGEEDVEELPEGKEADWIFGDFVLRNDLVEAVISNDGPNRRANMSTYYGVDGVTPGCLYDLTLRGAANDQLSIFAPSKQRGRVSHVRVVDDGSSGEAIVETFVSAALGGGLEKTHRYIVKDGWQGIVVVTSIRNRGAEPLKVEADAWGSFGTSGVFDEIHWGDAIDPADKAGYANGRIAHGEIAKASMTTTLDPSETYEAARFIAVGASPAEAVGLVLDRAGETGVVEGRITEKGAAGVATATVYLGEGKGAIPAYPDGEGRFSFRLPAGVHAAKVEDIGRPAAETTITVKAGGKTPLAIELAKAAAIDFEVRDKGGQSIPCKAQFLGIDGTESPNLGPENRAHGCRDQYHSERGDFRVQVPPGKYRVVVTRGIEFNHHAEEVEVEAGGEVLVKAVLERVVDTGGWVSADFHNHSTPSGDNTCGTDDRVINLAAEQVEFAPTTEHNRIYDWNPHIERLGLTGEIFTVPGVELTGSGAHLNAFPFKPRPRTQDAGAPVWNPDPRINAITLRDLQGPNPYRWVQINHPDMVENFVDRNGDGKADGGFTLLGSFVDGIETQNQRDSKILAGAPFYVAPAPGGGIGSKVEYIREFVWLQLLNQGHRIWGVAVCDAHRVHGNGVGGWRQYIPSSTDAPADIDWRELVRNSLGGPRVLSTGPFLEVQAAVGTIAGGSTTATGKITLNVRVQCADWIDIDRVQVLVNGRQVPELNFTRAANGGDFSDGVVKFDRDIEVPLSEDSHLIVVAIGENSDLSIGYGSSAVYASNRPCAYNNPIFVDVDGGGFQANGDTLGFDPPVKGISVEAARGALESKGISVE